MMTFNLSILECKFFFFISLDYSYITFNLSILECKSDFNAHSQSAFRTF